MSKFVITGGAGNVSKPLTEILLSKGHEVTVVGRTADKLAGLVSLGAKAAIGDLSDVPFLTKTFEGADGVYLLIPQAGIRQALSKPALTWLWVMYAPSRIPG